MKGIGSHIRRGDAGFTIIESVVALFVLVVGVLATFMLVEVANSRSSATRAREGATNLARELTEQVRTLRFADLTATVVPAALQAKPGLADALPATPGWQIVRRGYTFTIAPAVCSIDDAKDKYGDHAAGGFCADSSTTGNEDAKPEDFRRVHMDVSWQDKGAPRTVRLSATMSSTGQSAGMPVSDLRLTSPTSPDNAGTVTDPVIVTFASPLTFMAKAPSTASSLIWTLDGQAMSPAAVRAANGTDWTFSWDVAGRSDGYYTIGAQAVDAQGLVGPERTIKVQLLRGEPSAPTGFVGGYNTVVSSGSPADVAEFRWLANPERNVVGYRVYRPDGTLACPGNTTTLSLATSCIDFSPVAQTAVNRTYTVVALFRDGSLSVRESTKKTTYTINPPTTTTTGTQRLGLKTTTLNTGNNCRAGTQRDMEDGFTGGTTGATFSGASAAITFCSPPYAAGDSLPAQTFKFQANVTYTGTGAGCATTAQLQRNGSGGLSASNTIKASGLAEWTFTTTATSTLNAGDRLNLTLTWGTHANCNLTVLSYAASPEPGRLIFTATTTKSTRPSPPTGLSAVAQADGTVLVSWTAPSDGSASFYRIYKGGKEYTQRMPDTTGSGTETTYVDTDPQGTNDYYVTSVNPTLTESDFLGPARP